MPSGAVLVAFIPRPRVSSIDAAKVRRGHEHLFKFTPKKNAHGGGGHTAVTCCALLGVLANVRTHDLICIYYSLHIHCCDPSAPAPLHIAAAGDKEDSPEQLIKYFPNQLSANVAANFMAVLCQHDATEQIRKPQPKSDVTHLHVTSMWA